MSPPNKTNTLFELSKDIEAALRASGYTENDSIPIVSELPGSSNYKKQITDSFTSR